MKIFDFLLTRFTVSRPFFYGWEQRAFERRQEQRRLASQFTCRYGKD